MIAEIFGPELLVLLFLVIPALGIWAAVDAGTKPTWAFERAGQNKTLWIVLPLVGVFLCGIVAIVAAIIWFASIRPQVVAAVSGAPNVGFSGTAAIPAPGTVPPQPSASPPSQAVEAQWSRDPLGRHERRYWNGTAWTEHVSDGGVASTDPLDTDR